LFFFVSGKQRHPADSSEITDCFTASQQLFVRRDYSLVQRGVASFQAGMARFQYTKIEIDVHEATSRLFTKRWNDLHRSSADNATAGC